MAQNLDDLAKDVLEVKEHVKMIHQTYDTLYAQQNTKENQLKEIIIQLGVISKVVFSFQGSLPRPISPPNYEEVENEGPKFTYFKKFQSSSSLYLKVSEEFFTPRNMLQLFKGANLAREKQYLLKTKIENFKIMK